MRTIVRLIAFCIAIVWAFLFMPTAATAEEIPETIVEVNGAIHAYSLVYGTPVVATFSARSDLTNEIDASFEQFNRYAYITGSITEKSATFQTFASDGLKNLTGPIYTGSNVDGILAIYQRARGVPLSPLSISVAENGSFGADTTGSAGAELTIASMSNADAWVQKIEGLAPYANPPVPKVVNIPVSSSGTFVADEGGCNYSFSEYPGVSYCRSFRKRFFTSALLLQNAATPPGDITAESALNIEVSLVENGENRERQPGDDPEDAPDSCDFYPTKGNSRFTYQDPVATRGYPLINNIHFDTHAVEFDRPMGSATFTYDIHITTDEHLDGLHWTLVDGDASRLDYGLTSGMPTPEPGVYPTLTQTASGYLLEGAGSPENIYTAGNFTYTFDGDGKLIDITDPAGNIQRLTYTNGILSRVDDLNSQKALEFVSQGERIIQIVENGGGARTHLGYTNGLLTSISTDTGDDLEITSVDVTYTADNLLETITQDHDPGSTRTYSYTFAEPLVPGQLPVPLTNVIRGGQSTNAEYEKNKTTTTNSQGGVTVYEYNDNGDLTAITVPEGDGGTQTTRYVYDEAHNLLSVDDGTAVVEFDYNERGLPTEVRRGSDVTTIAYQGVDLLAMSDARGLIVEYEYGNPALPHHPTASRDGLGNSWSYEYNAFGQLTRITPPTPQQPITLTYEEEIDSPAYGYLRSIRDGAAGVTLFEKYDLLGDLTQWQDPTGMRAYREYDARHRVTRETYDDDTGTLRTYDGRFLKSTLDEAGREYRYTFCQGCENLEAISGPLSWNLKWQRDADFDITAFIDARNKTTTYTYDKGKNLTGIRYPDGSGRFFTTENGYLKTETNSRLQGQTSFYDTAGRLDAVRMDGTSESWELDFSYTLDSLLQSLADKEGSMVLSYDGAKRPTHIHYEYTGLAQAQDLFLTYYPDDSLQSLEWKQGETTVARWSYRYDGAGRLQFLTNSFGENTSFRYDAAGRLIEQANFGNLTSTTYSYTGARKWLSYLNHLTFRDKNGEPSLQSLASEEYRRDKSGLIKALRENDTLWNRYKYDKLARLRAASRNDVKTTYRYDRAGNLIKVNDERFARYDAANKIATLAGNQAVEYDADGNITLLSLAQNGSSDLTTETFTWDLRDKLITRTHNGVTTTYGYDGLGRRVSHEKNGEKTYFVHLGPLLLGEVAADGTPLKAYTWGASGLVSHRDLTIDESYWYHFGHRGDTKALTDSAGQAIATFRYDSYGTTVEKTGNVSTPFGFVGKYGCYTEDEFVLCGARWYSPELGRWLSRDPIGFEGGENLYGYALQNPIQYIDLNGDIPFDTIWDIGNVLYDFWTGDDEALVTDLAAFAIPYLPAGSTKITRTCAKAVKKRKKRTVSDRYKKHLTDRDLDAARRELKGETVARKRSGTPWDHVKEVRQAKKGLSNRIKQLKKKLAHPTITPTERGDLHRELSQASKLLDHSEGYIPRN